MNTEIQRLQTELAAAHQRIASLSQQLDAEIAKRAKLELAAGRAVAWMRALADGGDFDHHHALNCAVVNYRYTHDEEDWAINEPPCTCEFGRVLAGLEACLPLGELKVLEGK